MSFYHCVFVVTYSLHRAIRESVAQDEVRFAGHEKEPTEHRWVVLAPSEEVALADFTERHKHEIKEGSLYHMKIVGTERMELNRCLLSLELG